MPYCGESGAASITPRKSLLLPSASPAQTKRYEGSGGVRPALKELYSTVEEAKADISGLWALQQLIDKGLIDRAGERRMYTTFLASAFRTLRFGMDDSHARGMALQVNYLLDAGAYRVGADGTFSVDLPTARKAVEGGTAPVPVQQGQPAGNPVHPEHPVHGARQRTVEAAQGR